MTLERIFCHCEEQRDEAIFRFFNRPAVGLLKNPLLSDMILYVEQGYNSIRYCKGKEALL
jgi:hypothetical protein